MIYSNVKPTEISQCPTEKCSNLEEMIVQVSFWPHSPSVPLSLSKEYTAIWYIKFEEMKALC